MFKRVLLLVLGAAVMSVLMASVALAAYAPQDIYDDFADNGKLDRQYSDAELRAYLNNATLSQYTDPSVKNRLDTLVKSMVTRDTFPFTGFQMMIAGIIAAALVGGGFGLRRFARSERS